MIAWGPPKAATINGMVMNGPTPTICDMFIAVAWNGPTDRTKPLSPAADVFWSVLTADTFRTERG